MHNATKFVVVIAVIGAGICCALPFRRVEPGTGAVAGNYQSGQGPEATGAVDGAAGDSSQGMPAPPLRVGGVPGDPLQGLIEDREPPDGMGARPPQQEQAPAITAKPEPSRNSSFQKFANDSPPPDLPASFDPSGGPNTPPEPGAAPAATSGSSDAAKDEPAAVDNNLQQAETKDADPKQPQSAGPSPENDAAKPQSAEPGPAEKSADATALPKQPEGKDSSNESLPAGEDRALAEKTTQSNEDGPQPSDKSEPPQGIALSERTDVTTGSELSENEADRPEAVASGGPASTEVAENAVAGESPPSGQAPSPGGSPADNSMAQGDRSSELPQSQNVPAPMGGGENAANPPAEIASRTQSPANDSPLAAVPTAARSRCESGPRPRGVLAPAGHRGRATGDWPRFRQRGVAHGEPRSKTGRVGPAGDIAAGRLARGFRQPGCAGGYDPVPAAPDRRWRLACLPGRKVPGQPPALSRSFQRQPARACQS